MDLFSNPIYNGQFLSPNSAKPISAIVTNTAFKRPLIEAKVATDTLLGLPVKVVNGATTTSKNAGFELNPTTLTATATTDADTSFDGFAVYGSNVVLEDGDAFPSYKKGQIAYIALMGSGAELYLPCADTLIGKQVTASTGLVYDFATQQITEGTAGAGKLSLAGITLLSQVVNGVVSYNDNGVIKTKDSLVIKVRL